MPTVRAEISPQAVFPAPRGVSGVECLRVYPAEQWEKWGGEPGRFRVQEGDAWIARRGERVSFFTEDGVDRVLANWGRRALGLAQPDEQISPSLAKGTHVWVPLAFPVDDTSGKSETGWAKTTTRTAPFQDEYGEWRVWVFYRKDPVLLADLSRRERFDER